jgi:hypothetical protein
MQSADREQTLEIEVSDQLRQLLNLCGDAFQQEQRELTALPMGLDWQTCQVAASLCTSLTRGQRYSLTPAQQHALYHALSLARRQLNAEFHKHLRDLQKAMAAIVLAHTQTEMARLAAELPKKAERARQLLTTTLQSRGELLDACAAMMRKLHKRLGLPKPMA